MLQLLSSFGRESIPLHSSSPWTQSQLCHALSVSFSVPQEVLVQLWLQLFPWRVKEK